MAWTESQNRLLMKTKLMSIIRWKCPITSIRLGTTWLYDRSLLVPLDKGDFHPVVLWLTKDLWKQDIAKTDPGFLFSILAPPFITSRGYDIIRDPVIFRMKDFRNSFAMKNGTPY
jgi:hypothetical protein